jgi:hypothetical protein
VVALDGQLGRLVLVVVVGFALQTLTGALTYLLRRLGNRKLSGILDLAWPLCAAALPASHLGTEEAT